MPSWDVNGYVLLSVIDISDHWFLVPIEDKKLLSKEAFGFPFYPHFLA